MHGPASRSRCVLTLSRGSLCDARDGVTPATRATSRHRLRQFSSLPHSPCYLPCCPATRPATRSIKAKELQQKYSRTHHSGSHPVQGHTQKYESYSGSSAVHHHQPTTLRSLPGLRRACAWLHAGARRPLRLCRLAQLLACGLVRLQPVLGLAVPAQAQGAQVAKIARRMAKIRGAGATHGRLHARR